MGEPGEGSGVLRSLFTATADVSEGGGGSWGGVLRSLFIATADVSWEGVGGAGGGGVEESLYSHG